MQLQQRINLLIRLGEYMQNENSEFNQVKEKAYMENPWFITEFIQCAVKNICNSYLQKEKLEAWIKNYDIHNSFREIRVGIVMAGNIPLVGFHDLLCVFINGCKALIKPSSKDSVLIKHLVTKMIEMEPQVEGLISFADMLKSCDAYIATGSNNSGRYFEYYFGKYPSVIRKNKTSVAVLDGNETARELDKLTDDIHLYFGLGCRNVTQLYLPINYDFIPLLEALKKYEHFIDFHKYRNNYDYQLALLLMNSKYYMTNGSVLLNENESLFAPVSQVNYYYYDNMPHLETKLKNKIDIQCIVGNNYTPFGQAQHPQLADYADNIDSMQFLSALTT
ncbi:acyl-CoA reductase [soil metagenome]